MLSVAHRRTIWDLALVAVGLNAWVSVLLIPALHIERGPGTAAAALMGLSLLVFAAGVVTRDRTVLLAVYPATLVVPILANPKLAGVNVYSAGTFVLVAVGFVGYTVGAALLTHVASAPPVPEDRRPLAPPRDDSKWRRRRRMYVMLATVSAVFPGLLIYSLFLHPGVQQELQRFYPNRAQAASVLFGVFAIALWMTLFHLYIRVPLVAHIRGDPQSRADLMRLRRNLRRRGPRVRFYLWVAVALVLMVVAFLRR